MSSSEVAAALSVTRQTAHRNLAALVEAGDLVRTGQGRATRYFVSPSAALPGIAGWLDDEAGAAARLDDVGDSLRQRLGADDPLSSLAWAFDYMFVGERSDPFGPLVQMGGGQYPPPLREVDDTVLHLWEKLSGLVKHPYLTARLHDLLWVRKWSDRPYSHAVAAIDAYLEHVPPAADGIECMQGLVRAAALAKSLRNPDLYRRVTDAALIQASAELAQPEPAPGIALPLLSVAIESPSEDVQEQLAALLRDSWDMFGNPWNRDHIIRMQLAAADVSEVQRDKLLRRSVELWREQASSATGNRRRIFLQEALDRARAYELVDLADEIRQQIQEVEVDQGEWQTVSSTVEAPPGYIEDALSAISSADGWSACLDRLIAVLGPLTGSLEQNKDIVRRQAQQFRIQRLMAVEVLGPGNLPIFTPRTKADYDALDLSNQETWAITFGSRLAAAALDRTLAAHGPPAKAELVTYFTTPFIDPGTAERLAAGVEHFTRGRFDECVLVIIPRIETTIRTLARATGESIWWEPRPSKKLSRLDFGHQRSLGQLLDQLGGKMDEDFRRYLYTLLVNPLGYNLRNLYMHGLADQGTREHAAALIHAAVFLAGLQPGEKADEGR